MLNQQVMAAATSRDADAFPKISKALGLVIDICLAGIVFLVPLFFLPISLDILELSKQTLFLILVSVAITAWLGKSLADRKFFMARSWLNIVVALFGLGWLITSLFSKDLYISLVGNVGQMQFSFATIAGLIVFYFLVINHLGSVKKLYYLLYLYLISSLLVGAFGLLQLFGVFSLGWLIDLTKAISFNTIGTINALGVYMVVPLVLSASLTVFGCKDGTCRPSEKKIMGIVLNVLVWATMVVSLFVLILVDFWIAWAAVLFGMVLLVALPIIRSSKISHPIRIVVPIVLACIAILLLIFKTPINLQLPSEVSPSALASWSIAKAALQENPVFGTGPGTWIYDYAKYRSQVVNLSQFWNIRFERGLSASLTLPATIGIVGTVLLLMLILSSIVKSAKHLITEKNDDNWQMFLSVFAPWITLVFIGAIYNYNFAHVFAFGFFLALLAALIVKKAYVWEAAKGSTNSVVISTIFVILCVIGLSTIWLSGQRLAADAAYSNAVVSYRSGQPIDSAIDSLNSAVVMNRWNDVYFRNLSQAYLIKADREFPALTQDPNGGVKINQMISAALDTAKRATQINPMNVDNWENLAVIYQSIASFTQGADEFAIQNFKEALEREPNNPVYSNEIGRIHVVRADTLQALMQSSDSAARKNAEQNIKEELDQASEWLNRAIQAKPDFAPAHYYLGLVYERQGRIQDAVNKLEQVLTADNKDVGIAFQLAILYYRNNQKDAARSMLEQIVNLTPQYANARWYLAALYEEQGNYQKALEQVKIVAETNKDNKDVAERVAALEKLVTQGGTPTVEGIPEPVPEPITTNPDVQEQPFAPTP